MILSREQIGINREQAYSLLLKHLNNSNLQKHCLAVEFVMRAFANIFHEDEEVWGITGLLHDLDYEYTKNDIYRHGLEAERILSAAGVNEIIIQAIKAHNPVLEQDLNNLLAKTLFAVEELTGLIVACALVQPDKKLKSVGLKSLKKKFKQKSFAAGVDRDLIKKSEELLGLKLDDVFNIALHAMQEHANELGL